MMSTRKKACSTSKAKVRKILKEVDSWTSTAEKLLAKLKTMSKDVKAKKAELNDYLAAVTKEHQRAENVVSATKKTLNKQMGTLTASLLYNDDKGLDLTLKEVIFRPHFYG